MQGTFGTKGSLRTNRAGAGIGTSPGINPITPYSSASLDYRHSYVCPPHVFAAELNYVQKNQIFEHTVTQESRELYENRVTPFNTPPEPMRRPSYPESNGIDRSLPTNIPDHPTAIQVNGLRQETHEAIWPGYVDGTNSYDARTLVGNFIEERADKMYTPSYFKMPSGAGQWNTTYGLMTTNRDKRVIPPKGSSATTLFTTSVHDDNHSRFSTGGNEASSVGNKDLSDKWGFGGVESCGVPAQLWGDHRSNSRPATNYLNYQAGTQHTRQIIKTVDKPVTPYETTQRAATANHTHLSVSTERCDVHKPDFQVRDPTRDPISKNLCGLRSNQFATYNNDDATNNQKLGIIYNEKLRFTTQPTLEEYRNRWTKAGDRVKQRLNSTEHLDNFKEPEIKEMPLVRSSHIGNWH